ncbi:hypothetical protein [Mycoplasma suis]|uniref:Uncharacterized protein n=1 Tax=Mycoplasma suis (strain Illinois) TaxID=768700 RepID=F0QRP5_MYCSL|nr:hypothetical protein [Mycoplasma suis]ADX98165.1 hypothetical protein MSU_0634 [Mycoplasma suis str. Illinois]
MGHSRVKALLFSLPVAAGSGGVVLSNGIANNNSSIHPKTLLGQKFSNLISSLFHEKEKQENFLSFYENKVERTKSETKVSDFSSSNLEIQNEEKTRSLDIFEELKIQKDQDSDISVKGIFTEIQKEGKTREVNQKMSEKLLKVEEGLKEFANGFKGVMSEIKNWGENMKLLKDMERKIKEKDFSNLQTKSLESLTIEGKKGLLSFYEKFLELKEESEKLNDQLSEKGTKRRNARETTDNQEKSIVQFLKRIDWGNNVKTNLDQFSGGEGDSKEPYSYFMDKQEWELFKKSSENIQKIKEEESKLTFFEKLCIFPFNFACYSRPEKTIESNKLIVEKFLDLRIASRLLHKMGIIQGETKMFIPENK